MMKNKKNLKKNESRGKANFDFFSYVFFKNSKIFLEQYCTEALFKKSMKNPEKKSKF